MRESLSDLTDKEKEALRLLLAGHDAKSSASALDISVHTVNDRLRNARRKLGVSSSREAARILGDAEGAAPQSSAHTSFGIPPADPAKHTADLINTQPRKLFGLTWFAGGMLIMSIFIAIAVVAFVSNTEPAGESVDRSENTFIEEVRGPDQAEDLAALKTADAFIAKVDAADWEGSWAISGEYFQSLTTVEQWTAAAQTAREPLGKVKERRVATIQNVTSLPGAPDGDYKVLQYHSFFEGVDALTIETVVMIRRGGGHEIAGYFVRPAGT